MPILSRGRTRTWRDRPHDPIPYEPPADHYPLTTARGTYHMPPIAAPRHGCRVCPHIARCRELEAATDPVRCEKPLTAELSPTTYYEGRPPRLEPALDALFPEDPNPDGYLIQDPEHTFEEVTYR